MINDVGDITLKEILHPIYHWSTKKGFWPHSLRLFVIAFGVTISSLIGLSSIKISSLQTWLGASIWYLLAIPFVTVSIYWLIFWTGRAWWKLSFSRKINVVFAYNFANYPAFESAYDSMIAQLKNRIAESNLGGIIKIIKKPADTEFRNKTAAEAKTLLGSRASTLLVWGYPEITRQGVRLRTLVSYEFGYPNFLSQAYAKSAFGKDVQRALDGGLFGVAKFDISILGDAFDQYALDTISFILGMTAASYGDAERSSFFFEEFRRGYAQRDPLRKLDMGPAIGEVERSLVRIKVALANDCYQKSEYQQMWRYLESALKINPHDYSANMAAALYWEEANNRPKAKHFTQNAEDNHASGEYEHKFNKAYFALDEGRYEEAASLYNELTPVVLTNPNHMTTFFYIKYRATKNPVFLFGEGIVAAKWQDKRLGKKRLRAFIKKAREVGEQQYSILIGVAENVLAIT